MPNTKIVSLIDQIVSQIPIIPASKNYWLIRTESGRYYEAFRKYGFVAIGHESISLGRFFTLQTQFKKDVDGLQQELKRILIPVQSRDKKPSERERAAAIAAGQIIKFMLDVKKGDIIVIPSESSTRVSFGEITSTAVPELSDSQIAQTQCPYRKRKIVKWIKDIDRDQLDPLLYKGFQAHQAINNWNGYAEYVERTINNFFIQENVGGAVANVVLEVVAREQINAKQLFHMGLNLLEVTDDFFKKNSIPFSTDEVEVKINLNSPGKIQFKAPNAKTIWLIAVFGVLVTGGGLKIDRPQFKLDLSTQGIIQKVIDYQNNAHDRSKMDELVKQMDSLKVLPPDDALKVLKQLSTNKDLPK